MEREERLLSFFLAGTGLHDGIANREASLVHMFGVAQMSDVTSLTQLARFVGQSAAQPDGKAEGPSGNLARKPQRRSVGDLLGVVLTLSARTRRMVMPQVAIDLDVFAPNGARAVRVLRSARR
jgi:hypothetical protein